MRKVFRYFILGMALAAVVFISLDSSNPRRDCPVEKFWNENAGKTVRRLPVGVVPENVFISFGSRDFLDDFKIWKRLFSEVMAKGTYNCLTLTLRSNPELGDAETLAAAKMCFEMARKEGVKVYMDTDARIARREFFSKWPNEKQSVAKVESFKQKDGVAHFAFVFRDCNDHMSWGSKSTYRPLNAKVAAAYAIKMKADGTFDFSTLRKVDVESESKLEENREEFKFKDKSSYMDRSKVTITGKASNLKQGETLVVTALSEYYSIDVFSPNLLGFCRSLMERYKALGADGGMRDEWGFIPDHKPNLKTFWWSPNFEKAYNKSCGRNLLDDFPMMALGAKDDETRSKAIGVYMKEILKRNVEIEQDFYKADKEMFGDDVYVVKHPTWISAICPGEYFHNGLSWWQATRDWAQSDEFTPFYVDNAIAKKFGGPNWLNEGYTGTPERNVFRVWTYALCGGRQVYHGLYGNKQDMKKYADMPWEESRIRKATDLLQYGNVTAQSRVRLSNLITRSQVDSPVAWVFSHEGIVDWSRDGWNDHGERHILTCLSRGWWCDAYPASEFPIGTFSVDEDGFLRVGKQSYKVIVLYRLRPAEKAAFDSLVKGKALKTKVFTEPKVDELCAYLESLKLIPQPKVLGRTEAHGYYPEPDGTVRLIDGTAIRIKADYKNPCGLAIDETMDLNGVKVAYAAQGFFAARAKDEEVVAIAAGGLTKLECSGLSLKLATPEDVVLVKKDGKWRGVWQTRTPEKPIPAELKKITLHWTILVVPQS